MALKSLPKKCPWNNFDWDFLDFFLHMISFVHIRAQYMAVKISARERCPKVFSIHKKSRSQDGTALYLISFYTYIDSATTSSTSGTIRFNKPSIPDFKVILEEGQPLHDPRSSTVTIPLSNDLYAIAPPSCSTAGRT